MKRTDKHSWKSFVSENNGGFDTKSPGDLWAKIEEELPKEKPVEKEKIFHLWQVYKYAALFVIAMGLGYMAMYIHFTAPQNTADNQNVIEQVNQKMEPQLAYNQELAEVESYYSSEINDRLEELKSFENNELVIEELNLLQEEFDELKSEMGDHINDEKIVIALIQNYRLRLDLLKEILEELHPDDSKQNTRNYGNAKI